MELKSKKKKKREKQKNADNKTSFISELVVRRKTILRGRVQS